MDKNPQDNLILAMETSGDVCGVAVQRNEQFLTEHSFRHGMHLSERLFAHVEGVLREADAALDDVTTFAVGIGPGSFTGTRIGVMTMKTLAAISQKPLYGVNSLEAIAATYAGLEVVLVIPLLPCRAGVIFAAGYDVNTTVPEMVFPPAALSLEELVTRLSELDRRHVIFCGPALPQHREFLTSRLAEQGKQVSLGEAVIPAAAQVARLADLWQASGISGDDALELVPLYIAPPPISQPKPENRPPGDMRPIA